MLALLYYGSFERPGNRSAWKTYDWAITERLFEQGLIGDPRGTSKSLVFTPEGEARAKAAFEALFGAPSAPGGGCPAKAQKGKRARSNQGAFQALPFDLALVRTGRRRRVSSTVGAGPPYSSTIVLTV